MKTVKLVGLLTAVVLVCGCDSTRSISHSQYRSNTAPGRGLPPGATDPGFEYRGEISEFDVLGIAPGVAASQADIEQALADAGLVRLQSGHSILLIQSGASFPDGSMVKELSRHFRVVPFSGMPPVTQMPRGGRFESDDPAGFSRSLRLAAARGGVDVILCYWGILETRQARLATKTVSWAPVVNWILPDEREHMRIRLKLALVDVRTGSWAVLSPEPLEAARLSVSPRRAVADQKLVSDLKQRAYVSATQELLRKYSEIIPN